MSSATLGSFHCMMCGHDYQEPTVKGEDVERSCPKCRSNSIRVMKAGRRRAEAASAAQAGRQKARDTARAAVPGDGHGKAASGGSEYLLEPELRGR